MSTPEAKLCLCGGIQWFLSRAFYYPRENKWGEDQIYLKLHGRLRCFGGDAGTASIPASALRPAGFPLPFCRHFCLLTLQLPQSCLSSLVEQEKALMVVLGLLSFPFD